MGKASSNKKVARAAKAGGGRARAAGDRNIVFPAALALVVVLGTLLVVYAREERTATALESPLIGDHWHAATGFYVCDSLVPGLGEFSSPAGLHTHGTNGLIHIEPSSSAGSGQNATLLNTLEYAVEALGGDVLDERRLGVPGGETYTEGEDECPEGEGDPIVQVAVWDTAFAAAAGEDPDRVVTEDFEEVRFDQDGQVFTLAFAPRDTKIPAPPDVGELEPPSGAPAEDGGETPTEDSGTEETPSTSAPVEGEDTTETTTGGGTTDTTTADDSSATTEPES